MQVTFFLPSLSDNLLWPWGGSEHVDEDDGKPIDYEYTAEEITSTAGNISIQQQQVCCSFDLDEEQSSVLMLLHY
jgi:hypothetical protein